MAIFSLDVHSFQGKCTDATVKCAQKTFIDQDKGQQQPEPITAGAEIACSQSAEVEQERSNAAEERPAVGVKASTHQEPIVAIAGHDPAVLEIWNVKVILPICTCALSDLQRVQHHHLLAVPFTQQLQATLHNHCSSTRSVARCGVLSNVFCTVKQAFKVAHAADVFIASTSCMSQQRMQFLLFGCNQLSLMLLRQLCQGNNRWLAHASI